MTVLYTFHSTKDAAKSVKACESNGIEVSIVTIPEDISAECGIAFNIKLDDVEKTDILLKNLKINPIKYEQR